MNLTETDHDPGDRTSAQVSTINSTSVHRGIEALARSRFSLPHAHTVLITFGAGAAYYVGAIVGFALTFSTHAVSTLWPPNAVLLACLLLTPTRRWWLVLLGVFPVHVIVQLQSGVPTLMILCWFLSNISEALIGAYCIRGLIGSQLKFGTLWDAGVFVIFAVFLAPFVSSFIDAGFVVLVGWKADSYWQVWRMRFIANVLAELALVPFIVLWVTDGVVWLRHASLRRYAEACLLACGLVIISLLVFSRPGPGSSPALLYLPLPFLLWAAVRFGPAGASTSLLVVVLVSIWAATQGRGHFISGSPAENVLSLQLFLISVSLPLIFLAALVEERRAKEAALSDSEARYRALVMATANMVWRANAKGEGFLVSPRWHELTGQNEDEVTNFGWLKALHPKDRERSERLWKQAMTEKHVYENEFQVRARDMSYRHLYVQAVPIIASDGAVSEWIGTASDVTQERESALTVQRQRDELAHVARITTMGELAASLAHELNQPLTAILSNAQAAQRFLAADPANIGEIGAILRDIVADDSRAGEVIRRVRELVKKGDLEIEALDLETIVREVVSLIRSDAILHNVHVVLEFDPGTPRIQGDKVQLQQVMLNLLLNAFQAMKDCPVAERQVTVRTELNNSMTIVAVRDRGEGLNDDQLEKIFQPFYTTKNNGLGLGLAISRSIVEAHGGRLWAQNNPDRGATICFTVPVEREEGQAT
jgi:two-component system, LuxR family, sensor kinase FixL